MLTPLSAESLFMLADAGWDSKRLMMCCVQEINGLRNLPTSLDSGLRAPHNFSQFKYRQRAQ